MGRRVASPGKMGAVEKLVVKGDGIFFFTLFSGSYCPVVTSLYVYLEQRRLVWSGTERPTLGTCVKPLVLSYKSRLGGSRSGHSSFQFTDCLRISSEVGVPPTSYSQLAVAHVKSQISR